MSGRWGPLAHPGGGIGDRIAHRQVGDHLPAMRIASSTGTELPERMLKVRVKRAALKPRTSLPMIGTRSCQRVEGTLGGGLRCQRRKAHTAMTAAIST